MSVLTKSAQLPVQYEEACRALVACTTIDEAKYFSDKSDALAAWAKIYKSDQAALEAKRLKLHAYRRMGQLAKEIRPGGHLPSGGHCKVGTNLPGSKSLLLEQGFCSSEVANMTRLARATPSRFNLIVSMPRPPSPEMAVRHHLSPSSDAWKKFRRAPMDMRSFCRSNNAKDLALAMSPDEAVIARAAMREIQDWIDIFDQYLPKGKGK